MTTNKNTISKSEMEAYLDGSLSDAQKSAIDKKLAEDPFQADAVEGFKEFPDAISQYGDVSTKLKLKSSKGWSFSYTITLAVVAMVGVSYLGSQFLAPPVKQVETSKKQKTVKQEKPIVIIEELTDDEIDLAEEMPEDKLLNSANVIVESPVVLDVKPNIESKAKQVEITRILNLKKVESKSIGELVQPLQKNDIIYSNVKTLHLSDLLVVDYSKIYTSKIPQRNFTYNGTPANLENKKDVLNEAQTTDKYIKYIPYMDFLAEAQSKFRKNHFKDALKDYKKIISEFPSDLNAHFYISLCYYNINKLKKSVEHLSIVEKHFYNTFHEEAKWYKALCYEEMGKEIECISLLNEIINEKGFYAKKAQVMLVDL